MFSSVSVNVSAPSVGDDPGGVVPPDPLRVEHARDSLSAFGCEPSRGSVELDRARTIPGCLRRAVVGEPVNERVRVSDRPRVGPGSLE
jgi:hypothetical protein